MRTSRVGKALVAVMAAALAFVVVGLPTRVIGMVDSEYCFEHDHRPPTTAFHEEELGFFPPDPVCRFTLADGTVVVQGPGWWPAASLAIALVWGLLVLRYWRPDSVQENQ